MRKSQIHPRENLAATLGAAGLAGPAPSSWRRGLYQPRAGPLCISATTQGVSPRLLSVLVLTRRASGTAQECA
jgi:hypothetical protein